MERDASPTTLSLSQERSWFLDQFVQHAALNIALGVRVRGPLDASLLDLAFCDALAGGDALTTTVDAVGGVPVATERTVRRRPEDARRQEERISAEGRPAPSVRLTDLSGLPEPNRGEQARAACLEAAAAPFDLAVGPLARADLIRLASDEHLLLLSAHRVGADRYSLARLVEQMAHFYTERTGGARTVTPSGDFAAFAAKQRQAVAQPQFAETADAWNKYLVDVPPIELPLDRNRSIQPHYEAETVTRELDRTLIAQASAVAERLAVAGGDVLRAGFIALLHRYTGQERLAIGTTAARDESAHSLLGPVDTLAVLRSDAPADLSFAALLGSPSTAPPPIPFEKLVDVVDPPRDPSRSPITQVVVSTIEAVHTAGFAEASIVDQFTQSTNASLYDLEVWLEPAGATPRIAAVYRTDLFDRPTIERMLAHYERLLRSALERPDTAIAALPLLGEQERARLLSEFNDTDVPFPSDAVVHELFEAQALRSPDARAVTFEGRHLNYRELNLRANRLAHFLRSQGVGRGTLVGVCLERSFDLIVTVLAVLKSGGAYVPLDPAYPSDRLAFMLEDTAAPIVLTQRKFADTAPTGDHTTLFVLDDDGLRAELDVQPSQNPDNVNEAGDLTYIVYTSGSTGRPKGVRTVHRGVVRLVINTDILELDENTSYLQISPLSFDANTLEIYGPLLNGGRVVLLPPQLPTPALVARTVREQDVDTLWLVAPLAHLTIDTHLHDLTGLRQFMAGGDVLSIPHMRTVRERLPHVKLVNGYGPTEVTAFSVTQRIDHIDPDWPSVPIGRPMHNTTAYILDELSQPVPIGVWGELYLGGPGVAQGYHHRPDLNATRFLPDPFRPGPGAQLYRTGDRCRWLPDGAVQFQGRLDTQVKVDGLRIELGEIQSVVAAHESVGAAVVVAPYLGSRRSLVAYVVPTDAATFDVEALRTSISSLLPSVMVPAHYVMLDTIPLTPNNKVDFHALPAPDLAHGAALRAPETPTQQALAEIWQEILGVPQVGLDDNFFQLGGHSLRAVPMIVAVSTRFGVDLAVQDVFEAPVLGRLAERIEQLVFAAVPPEELERLLAEVTGG